MRMDIGYAVIKFVNTNELGNRVVFEGGGVTPSDPTPLCTIIHTNSK
jgi:hypothetical protein